MTSTQATALRNELEREGNHTLVYVDHCDPMCKQAGFMTVAIKSEGRVLHKESGYEVRNYRIYHEAS